MNRMEVLNRAADYLRNRISEVGVPTPSIGMILGSGLGVLGEEVENPLIIPYKDIPGFPVSTVADHAGQLVIGELEGKSVMVMQGRFHYYEGYTMAEAAFPIPVMKLLGMDKVLITNAAGGSNTTYKPGTLMLIRDHIKFVDDTPLRGLNLDELGPRFPDMTYAYPENLRNMAKQVAESQGTTLQEGVYMMFPGPTYETPAEVKLAQILGADAVGMSTVPEVIAANHCGMKVLGISCITNMAAGVMDQPLNHAEVLEVGAMVKEQFINLVRGITKAW